MELIKKWHIIGFVMIVIFGSLFHFVYQWSGKNPVVGIFGAINESTWEHLKLLFWPALFYSIIEYIYIGKTFNNFFVAKAVSFIVGISLIIIIFYTYTGIFGKHNFFADIGLFILSVFVTQYLSYKIIFKEDQYTYNQNVIAIFSIILLTLFFIVFTFNPPHIPLFEDPLTNTYGISQ